MPQYIKIAVQAVSESFLALPQHGEGQKYTVASGRGLVLGVFLLASAGQVAGGGGGGDQKRVAAKGSRTAGEEEQLRLLFGGSVSCSSLVQRVGKLRFLSVPKNNSRMTKRILCELIHRWKSRLHFSSAVNSSLDSDNVCRMHNYYQHLHGVSPSWDDSEGVQTTFFVVRDPIDRFTSIYVGDCGQHTNSIHEMAQLVYEIFKYGKRPRDIRRLSYFKHHFAPHTCFCDIAKNGELYEKLYYSRNTTALVQQMQVIFDKAGIPREYSQQVRVRVRTMYEQALSRMHRTATNANRNSTKYDEWKHQVLSNPTTLRYVLALYDSDYNEFDFERPTPE